MAYVKTVWVDEANPPVSAANLNHLEQGVFNNDAAIAAHAAAADPHSQYALDTDLGLYVPKSLLTAKGDLFVASASGVISRLPAGATDGHVLTRDAAQALGVKWAAAAAAPSSKIDYAQITAPVTITATTEATANAVVTGAAVVYDGTTEIQIDFFAPDSVQNTTAQEMWLVLYDGAASIGVLAHYKFPPSGLPLFGRRCFTPAAGTRTYSIRAYKAGSGATVSVQAGLGGSGALVPACMRITKAA